MNNRTILCGLLLVLAGCTSNGEQDDKKDQIWLINPPKEAKLEIDDFKYEWNDIDKDRQGRRNPYQVARWVTERHDAVEACLRNSPPATTQAIALMEQILQRRPDASKDRYLLARVRFGLAAYWFKAADVVAYNMDWIAKYKKLKPNSQDLDDEQVEKVLKAAEPWLKDANEKLRTNAKESLRHFGLYRRRRPDDKRVLDFLWKLHFYLQDYERALRWLKYLLSELDAQGVPEQDPLRKDYVHIRDRLTDYMVNLKIEGVGKGDRLGASVLPWKDKRSREIRKRMHPRQE